MDYITVLFHHISFGHKNYNEKHSGASWLAFTTIMKTGLFKINVFLSKVLIKGALTLIPGRWDVSQDVRKVAVVTGKDDERREKEAMERGGDRDEAWEKKTADYTGGML